MEPHTGFVAAAYAVTALVVVGMVLAILLDHRRQAAILARLADRPGRGGRARASAEEDDHEP